MLCAIVAAVEGVVSVRGRRRAGGLGKVGSSEAAIYT